MAIQTRIVNNSYTEIYTGGGNFITQAYPTNFHQFWTHKILTPSENISDFMEVTASERTALEQSDAAWTRPPQSFIDKWNARLSLYPDSQTRDIDGYDEASGEFILNGLHFSYADAMMIDICSETVAGDPYKLYYATPLPVKTLFWPFTRGDYGNNLNYMFCNQPRLEILQIQTKFGARIFAGLISYMFGSCTALKEIRGTIVPQYATVASDYTNAFLGCVALKEVKLEHIKFSISFADSPNLSLASISFMVTNAANTAPITITLHPEAYARVTDDIIAAATAKQITIAST